MKSFSFVYWRRATAAGAAGVPDMRRSASSDEILIIVENCIFDREHMLHALHALHKPTNLRVVSFEQRLSHGDPARRKDDGTAYRDSLLPTPWE